MKRGSGILELNFHHVEAFVIAQADIVAWAILLDEFAFQNKSFLLITYDLKVEVLNTVNERTGFAVSTHFAGGHEVVADTFFEVASFAHINDAPQSVPHQVNAGLVRRVPEFLLDLGCAHR